MAVGDSGLESGLISSYYMYYIWRLPCSILYYIVPGWYVYTSRCENILASSLICKIDLQDWEASTGIISFHRGMHSHFTAQLYYIVLYRGPIPRKLSTPYFPKFREECFYIKKGSWPINWIFRHWLRMSFFFTENSNKCSWVMTTHDSWESFHMEGLFPRSMGSGTVFFFGIGPKSLLLSGKPHMNE